MRRFILFLTLLAAPAAATAQEVAYQPAPEVKGRPAAGASLYPMALIDEATVTLAPLWFRPYPKLPWKQAVSCLARMGIPMKNVGEPPELAIIPFVQTFRVVDIVRDSLIASVDSTAELGRFTPPTVGYSFLRTNMVIATEAYRNNTILLRHEAMHFILWRTVGYFGHLPNTKKYFLACDENFGDQA